MGNRMYRVPCWAMLALVVLEPAEDRVFSDAGPILVVESIRELPIVPLFSTALPDASIAMALEASL